MRSRSPNCRRPTAKGRSRDFADKIYDWIVDKLPRRKRYPIYRESLFAAGLGLRRGRARAARRDRRGDPQRPGDRRPGPQRRHPGAALQAGAGRADAVDRQRRDRAGAAHGAARAATHLRRGAAGHGAAVVLSRRHDRAADPPAGRGGRARARPPRPGRDPGLHPARRRDRRSLRLAARDDRRAVAAHERDRALRRRCRARDQEPAELAEKRRRNRGADRGPGEPAAADGDHPRRCRAARPADHRHFRRLAPRRRIEPPRAGAGRYRRDAARAGRRARGDPRRGRGRVSSSICPSAAASWSCPGSRPGCRRCSAT